MSFQIWYTRTCDRCGAATATEEMTQDADRAAIVACTERMRLANRASDYCPRCANIVRGGQQLEEGEE
jgi:RNA polymerase subunit RPABC4/transcription elongation factor Spt4